MQNPSLISRFQKYFKNKLLRVDILDHPGNNMNYKVQTPEEEFIIKEYSTFQNDNWNRGLREFDSLMYLRKKGIEGLPKPLNFFKEDNIAIYSFLPGKLLKPDEVEREDILVASDFLIKLHKIDSKSKASVPEERTACFSIQDYLKLLNTRLKNLSNYNESYLLANELKKLLETDVIPLKDKLIQELKNITDYRLSLNEQVLTPGDFGFHNILVEPTKPNKTYSFLDFEYFGRDDPVKQLLDFLHHDRHKAIPLELKNLFLENYLEKTDFREEIKNRIQTIDPLIGLNWALIYLTPFTKQQANEEDLLRTRLNKAKTKIENLRYLKSNIQ